MSKLPSLFDGPIAQEYGELATTIRASECSNGQTCGSQCTNEGECSREQADASCLAAPSQSARHEAFASTVAGWSEPPARRN